jgi:hypothetical protein
MTATVAEFNMPSLGSCPAGNDLVDNPNLFRGSRVIVQKIFAMFSENVSDFNGRFAGWTACLAAIYTH